jgi:hypothetical protein
MNKEGSVFSTEGTPLAMDPSVESAASLPGVLLELLVGRSTNMHSIQEHQKGKKGSANFWDNHHCTNLELFEHNNKVDLETQEKIDVLETSKMLQGLQQISHREFGLF